MSDPGSSSSASSHARMSPPGSGSGNSSMPPQPSPDQFPPNSQNPPSVHPLYGSDRTTDATLMPSLSDPQNIQDPMSKSSGGDPLSMSACSNVADQILPSQLGGNNVHEELQLSASRSSDDVRNQSESQKIYHKQLRLLLLRHAYSCKHEAEKCPITCHCALMKQVWEHINQCHDNQCTVQHCLSSRYVLSHYRRCKDPKCLPCGPVRQSIRKSRDHQKSSGTTKPAGGANSLDSLGCQGTATPPSAQSSVQEPERKRAKLDHPSDHPISMDQPISQPPQQEIPSMDSPLPPPIPPPLSEPALSSMAELHEAPSSQPKKVDPADSALSEPIVQVEPVASKAKVASKDVSSEAAKSALDDRSLRILHLWRQRRKAKILSTCSEVLKGLQSSTISQDNQLDNVSNAGLNDTSTGGTAGTATMDLVLDEHLPGATTENSNGYDAGKRYDDDHDDKKPSAKKF